METICSHVANGGDLIELCEAWDVPFGRISNWIRSDKEGRGSRYIEAINDRTEWAQERILREVRQMGLIDIRKVFDDSGNILPPCQWPREVAAAVSSIEVDELYEGTGKERTRVGDTKKVKLWNKLKALEMLGKEFSMFKEKMDVNHSGKVSLADLVKESFKGGDEENQSGG